MAQLRHSIEEPWQQWELSHFDIEAYKSKSLDEVHFDVCAAWEPAAVTD